ncbi:MAG TPA: BTAD domain-containing putative transcriptional regulator [Acidimicrobiales bacterium]|nr:BTAD domain-containing putative transcriptional regulator [Acidimicrobiales bacterium]
MFELRLLGSTEVRVDGAPVPLPLQLRRLIAVLALAGRGGATTYQLIEALWRHDPPDNAVGTLFAHVSKLRRSLGRHRGLVVNTRPGYRLDAAPDSLDIVRFEQQLARARQLTRHEDASGAADAFEAALGEWHGDALAEFSDEEFARAEATRLTQLRVAATRALAATWTQIGRVEEADELLDRLALAGPFGAGFTLPRGMGR